MSAPVRDPRFVPAQRPSPGRRVGRSVAVLLGALLFALVTWGFPALFHQRYDPATHPAPAAAAPAAPADPSWHPVPTADQDRIYQEQTEVLAAHPGVAVEGRDGYFFLGDILNQNFAQAMGRRYYSRQEVQDTVDALAAQRTWLDERGIPNLVVLVPATWSVYQDKLPAWTDGQLLTPRIADQLLTADPAIFLDLRPALTAARATADTYARLNSHWTPFGATVGLRTTLERLAATHPQLADLRLPDVTGTRTVDASNEFGPLIGVPGANDWVLPEFAEPLPDFQLTTADGVSTTVPGDTVVDPADYPAETVNDQAGNDHRALVLGDSATGMMSPYVADSFGSTWLVRHHWDEPDQRPNVPALVDEYRPDVVITFLSERNLNVPTADAPLYEGAAAFEAPGAGTSTAWSTAAGPDGSAGAISLSGPSLAAGVTATLPSLPTGPLAGRIELSADQPTNLSVTAQTSAGPITTVLHLATGRNVVYLTLPAGITDPVLQLQRSGDQGDADIRSVDLRSTA